MKKLIKQSIAVKDNGEVYRCDGMNIFTADWVIGWVWTDGTTSYRKPSADMPSYVINALQGK